MKTIFFKMAEKSLSGIFLYPIDVLWILSGENKIWHVKIIYLRKNTSNAYTIIIDHMYKIKW